MYVPKHFEENRLAVLHELMRNKPLATLVTYSDAGLQANHIPLLWQATSNLGVLKGHVARGNSMWREFNPEVEVLAIFQGANHYISPNWYPSKQQHGKVVPTWNYQTCHVYGKLRIIDDAQWLRNLVQELTNVHEANSPSPWQVSDAPVDYITTMLSQIVGIEIEITRIQGKTKASQNQPVANQQGVVEALRQVDSEEARQMAQHVQTNLDFAR